MPTHLAFYIEKYQLRRHYLIKIGECATIRSMNQSKDHYLSRKLIPPNDTYFLLGPRGTGKSTWLLHQYPDAVRIDLLLGEEERRYSSYPERIRELAESLKPGSVLILDEIQRVPQLLPEIHALIEKKLGIQIILTGSSARKLRRAVSDLLGGRALMRQNGAFSGIRIGPGVFHGKGFNHRINPPYLDLARPAREIARLFAPLFERRSSS